MEVARTLTVNGREEWRSWLEVKCDREQEIWLVFYRKATGKQTVSLPEAQDEAICFGWVDSAEKRSIGNGMPSGSLPGSRGRTGRRATSAGHGG